MHLHLEPPVGPVHVRSGVGLILVAAYCHHGFRRCNLVMIIVNRAKGTK
jgi:hypothetical protein